MFFHALASTKPGSVVLRLMRNWQHSTNQVILCVCVRETEIAHPAFAVHSSSSLRHVELNDGTATGGGEPTRAQRKVKVTCSDLKQHTSTQRGVGHNGTVIMPIAPVQRNSDFAPGSEPTPFLLKQADVSVLATDKVGEHGPGATRAKAKAMSHTRPSDSTAF
eukprot:2497897-Amphidinium_carterae.1